MWIVYICTIYVWNCDCSYDNECPKMVHEDDAMMQWCDDAYYTMHSMMYMYHMLWWTLYDAHSPIPAIHSDLMI